MINKTNLQILPYLILQIILILILCLLPHTLIVSSSVVMFLLGAVLLMHSNKLINSGSWSNLNIYNFVIIIVTIFFIPAYAAFRTHIVVFVGVALIIANLVSAITLVSFRSKKSIKSKFVKKSNTDVKSILKKQKKQPYSLVAIKGGSKFHSLDCKMVENKHKKRLKYYISAHEAQKDGLKPCKLCKAVSYLHHW